MAEIFALDAGPLGLACGNPARDEVRRFNLWMLLAKADGVWIVVPDIVDYEVRRGLISEAGRGAMGLKRLDALYALVRTIPISTASLKFAAELWGKALLDGATISDTRALGADAILAAQ